MHSALGLGSHHSVISGTTHKALRHRTYFPMTYDLVRLNQQQRSLEELYMVRDSVFSNKFPEAARVNGVFRLTPQQRRDTHYNDVMPAIRKRTVMQRRIQRQMAINAQAIKEAEQAKREDPRAFLGSPDSDVYFRPTPKSVKQEEEQQQHQPYNTWPNYWQHPSRAAALVPRPKWERHPELGGITRVHQNVSRYSNSY